MYLYSCLTGVLTSVPFDVLLLVSTSNVVVELELEFESAGSLVVGAVGLVQNCSSELSPHEATPSHLKLISIQILEDEHLNSVLLHSSRKNSNNNINLKLI